MKVRCLNCMKEYDDQYGVCHHCGFVKGTPPKEPYHLLPGEVLKNRYDVGTVISYGGFGVVYRAWDRQLEVVVAIKEFFPTALVTRVPGQRQVRLSAKKKKQSFDDGIKAFLLEARNTAKFGKHPNITNIFDFFEENGTAYMVMEYLEGETLKEYLKRSEDKKLSIEETINILLSVINALKEVHKQKILHRDIAPDNIFICKDKTVKLIDFGAGKFADEDRSLTREVVVKPGYAPPEQYNEKSVQAAWTDIYALGATMYRAITGVVPDESTNRVEEDKVIPPKQIDPDIPDYIDACLMRAMSVTPEFRFRSVQEFEEAILNKRRVLTEVQQRKRLLRRRFMSVAAVLVVIGIVGLFAYKDYQDNKQFLALEDAEITLWMPVGEAGEEYAREEIAGLMDEFVNKYTDATEEHGAVSVDVVFIPEEEYGIRLEDAFSNGNAPTVFDGRYFSQEMKGNTENLEIIAQMTEDQTNFLDDYGKYFPDGRQMPIGYTIPIVYSNTTIITDTDTSSLGDNNSEEFLAGRTPLIIADTLMYASVQGTDGHSQVNLAGKYAVSPVPLDEIQGKFLSTWCLSSQGSKEQIHAGQVLIYYFLGADAQDAYYIQHTNGLPINKAMLERYVGINREMNFLVDTVKNTTFARDNQIDMGQYCKELFTTLFVETEENLYQLQEEILTGGDVQ